MTQFARWLWRHHRHHYVVALGVVGATVLCIGLVVPGILVASLFANFSITQAAQWCVAGVILTYVGAVIGMGLSPDTLRPVAAWGRWDRSDPRGAWNAALAMPATIARSVAKTQWVMHSFVSAAFAFAISDLSLLDTVAIAVGSSFLVVVGGIAFGNGLHVLLRPALDEMADELPFTERPSIRGWNLAGRLNLGFGTLCVVSGIGVVAAVRGHEATMRDYIVALGVSVLMTAYVMVIFDAGLVRPTVSAVRDILAAIDRVRDGEVTTKVPVTSVDEFGDLAVAFNDMQEAMRERESLRAAFGSYVDPSLAQRVLLQNDSIFEGEEVDVTVFFVDVRGFTSYSEQVSAPEAVGRLNRLFEILVPVINAAGGHANHYLGDGLLAVFGTPTPLENHADKAVAAAIEIFSQVNREFRGDVRVGIGINTGPVIAGSIGGGGRYEFTVIGDTVNVASRVESMTKETGDAILMTQATIDAMTTRPCMKTLDRGEIELRGKTQRVCVHACIAAAEAPAHL